MLRDAMADAGTALVRRWLVWSAVTTATMLSGAGTGWSTGLRRYYRAIAAVTVLVIAVLGVLATLDLFDLGGPGCPGWGTARGSPSWPADWPARSSYRWCCRCSGAGSGSRAPSSG